jgi:hypothetical protein
MEPFMDRRFTVPSRTVFEPDDDVNDDVYGWLCACYNWS